MKTLVGSNESWSLTLDIGLIRILKSKFGYLVFQCLPMFVRGIVDKHLFALCINKSQ